MHSVLHEKYYNIGNSEKYLIQILSQAKSSVLKLPEVCGVSKSLDPNIQQVMKPLISKVNEFSQIKPQTGQERAGFRRNKPYVKQLIAQSVKHSQKIPEVTKIEKQVIKMPSHAIPVQSISNQSTEAINRRMMQTISKDNAFYPDSVYRPLSKPIKIPMPEFPGNMDINPECNTDFEENSPFQEGVISET